MKYKLSFVINNKFYTKNIENVLETKEQIQNYIDKMILSFDEYGINIRYILISKLFKGPNIGIFYFDIEKSFQKLFNDFSYVPNDNLVKLHLDGTNESRFDENMPEVHSYKRVCLPGWSGYVEGICDGEWNGFETPLVKFDQLLRFNELNDNLYDAFFEVTEAGEPVIIKSKNEGNPDEIIEPIIMNGENYYDISLGMVWVEYI